MSWLIAGAGSGRGTIGMCVGETTGMPEALETGERRVTADEWDSGEAVVIVRRR